MIFVKTVTMERSSFPVSDDLCQSGHDGAFIVPGFEVFVPKRPRWSVHRSRFRMICAKAVTMERSMFPVLEGLDQSGHDVNIFGLNEKNISSP